MWNYASGIGVMLVYCILAIGGVATYMRSKRVVAFVGCSAAILLALSKVILSRLVAVPVLEWYFKIKFPPENVFETKVYYWWLTGGWYFETIMFAVFSIAYTWHEISGACARPKNTEHR